MGVRGEHAGVALGMKLEAARGVVNDALDAVCDAAEAVMGYLGTAASWAFGAFEKLKAAAASLMDRIMKMLRRLRGRKAAAAARREWDRAAAAAAHQEDVGHGGVNVLSRASARVAGYGRLLDARALPPPSSAIVVSATGRSAPGRELTMLGSVAVSARRAARRPSEMMALLDEVVVEAALGDRIPEDARSCISVVVAAVGIGLEAIAAVDS